MAPLRDKIFVISLMVILALVVMALPRIHAAPVSADTAAPAATSDQPVSDAWITTKVQSELATTHGVHSMDISVKTVNGVVTLAGTQPTQAAIEAAVVATRAVKGVKDVDQSRLRTTRQ